MNNGTRIPFPSVRSSKTSKNGKSFGLLNLRAQATSLLPKSLSTEKICQASTLVRKTLPQGRLMKSESKASKINHQSNKMIVDETFDAASSTVRNSTIKIDKLKMASNMAPPSVQSTPRLLTRSETFTRDCDDSDVDRLPKENQSKMTQSANVTHDLSNQRRKSGVPMVNNDTLTWVNGSILDSSNLFETSLSYLNNTKLNLDTFKSSSLADISVVSAHNESPCLKQGKSLDGNTTLVPGDMLRNDVKSKRLLSSTLESNNLLDVSETISPSRFWANISQDVTPTNRNTTQLICMSSSDKQFGDVTLVAAENRRCSAESMDVDESPDSACSAGKSNCIKILFVD